MVEPERKPYRRNDDKKEDRRPLYIIHNHHTHSGEDCMVIKIWGRTTSGASAKSRPLAGRKTPPTWLVAAADKAVIGVRTLGPVQ